MKYDETNLQIIKSLREETSLLQIAKQKLLDHQKSQTRSFIQLGQISVPCEREPIYIGLKVPRNKKESRFSEKNAYETAIFEYFADNYSYITPRLIANFEVNGMHGALLEDLTKGGKYRFMEGGRHSDISILAEIFHDVELHSDESHDLRKCSVEVHEEYIPGIGSYSHSALIDFDHMIKALKEPFASQFAARKDAFLSDNYLIRID